MSTKEVWKLTLRPGITTVPLPVGAKILHVREQNEFPNLWAEVDPSAPTEPRCFRAYMTGEPITRPESAYVGTVHLRGGSFVLHVYEEPR